MFKQQIMMEAKYYCPSSWLVEYLEKELQSLQPRQEGSNAGEGYGKPKFIRKKDRRGNVAKDKIDSMKRIFQSFADLLYFLETIYKHNELQDLFEKDLKDLFGISIDSTYLPPHKYQVSAFERLVRAILLIDVGKTRELDFRMFLIKILIWCCIEAMRSRITDNNERRIMVPDADRIWLWSNLLSGRVPNEPVSARRCLGFWLLDNK